MSIVEDPAEIRGLAFVVTSTPCWLCEIFQQLSRAAGRGDGIKDLRFEG